MNQNHEADETMRLCLPLILREHMSLRKIKLQFITNSQEHTNVDLHFRLTVSIQLYKLKSTNNSL